MTRTISVKGKAIVKAPADITGVEATIYGHRMEFDDAIKAMAETTAKLKDAIESAGIPRSDLKTSKVSVAQAYREEKIGSNQYGDKFRDVPNGFEYSQNIRFEFENDNVKLSKAISGILACKVEPMITFYFRNSDMEGMKNKALSDACVNAKNEAETIVTSVGAKLGRLLSVQRNSRSYYDDDEYYACKTKMACPSMAEPMIDVEPEDVSVEESVNMEWEIED